MSLFKKNHHSESPYCYSGTDVLINKFGIKNFDDLLECERSYTSKRQAYLEQNPVKGEYDLKHLQDIHKYLFQDVYDWAGELRKTNISKGESFCDVREIESRFSDLHNHLKYFNYLKDVHDDKEYAKVLSNYFCEINNIHPFREGNGRTQRVFISQLCKESGRIISFENISRDEMITASKAGINGDFEPMAMLFEKNIVHESTFDITKYPKIMQQMNDNSHSEDNQFDF